MPVSSDRGTENVRDHARRAPRNPQTGDEMQRSPENLWRAATRPADDLKDSQSLAPRVGGIRTALLAHPIGEAGGEARDDRR